MTDPAPTGRPSVDDVHRALLERISSSSFAVGARLPSCRALAGELGSNPSTVDRAIQRLAAAGLVRTSPRRGTFLSATEAPGVDLFATLSTDMDRLVARATAAGVSSEELRRRFDQALDRDGRRPRVAFVECNAYDLDRMADLVENATGVSLKRVLLDDTNETHDAEAQPGSSRLDTDYDVIAAPLFHLADLAQRVSRLDTVVEINFVAAPEILRRLATLRSGRRVVVAAPTRRGLDRISALVRQYYPDEVEQFLVGVDPPEALADADVVVRSHAADLPDAARALLRAHEEIVVDWELDPASAHGFRARVAEASDRRSIIGSTTGVDRPWRPRGT